MIDSKIVVKYGVALYNKLLKIFSTKKKEVNTVIQNWAKLKYPRSDL